MSSDVEFRVVQTDDGLKDGQNKCRTCGGTDISLNIDSGRLRCNTCRHEPEPEFFSKSVTDIDSLDEHIIGSGAANIEASADEVITFKCSSCAAEVVVDTSESLQARCHWCRNTLSVNQKIPNGAVPDKVLPFAKKREDAKTAIEKFVGKRQFYAHKTFKAEFCAENVIGVYLPYMVVDVNSSASMSGQGEVYIDSYTVNSTTYYNADLYNVERGFDLVVENLTIEADTEKLQHQSTGRTNNIVNAIKPYDTENCLKWNANYMRGFNSQKRDVNVEDLVDLKEVKIKDIARHQARETAEQYDRGIRWDEEKLDIHGSQWKAAYLPIWLYSYMHNDVVHYVAVNGRTLKTMGSIPINMGRLWGISSIVGAIGGIAGLALFALLMFLYVEEAWVAFALFGTGPAFFAWVYRKYRNKDARFEHETSANARIENLTESDEFVEHIKGTTAKEIRGRNDTDVDYGGKE